MHYNVQGNDFELVKMVKYNENTHDTTSPCYAFGIYCFWSQRAAKILNKGKKIYVYNKSLHFISKKKWRGEWESVSIFCCFLTMFQL